MLSLELVVNKYLVCVDTVAAPTSDEDLRAHAFASELLQICHVAHQSTNQEQEEGSKEIGEKKRRREAGELLAFFPPPWSGALRHPCRDGCCGEVGLGPCSNRPESVRRGVQLIKKVICPHLTRPAANRYTKIFPVTSRVCLMLFFFSVTKKALRKQLQCRDQSDDENLLRDGDALVGAPTDEIRYHRKLQACKLSISIYAHIYIYRHKLFKRPYGRCRRPISMPSLKGRPLEYGIRIHI